MRRIVGFLLALSMLFSCAFAELSQEDPIASLEELLGFISDPEFELGEFTIKVSGMFTSVQQTDKFIDLDGKIRIELVDITTLGLTQEELASIDADTLKQILTLNYVVSMEDGGLADIESGNIDEEISYVCGYSEYDGGCVGIAFVFNGTSIVGISSVVTSGLAEALEMNNKEASAWQLRQVLDGFQTNG